MRFVGFGTPRVCRGKCLGQLTSYMNGRQGELQDFSLCFRIELGDLAALCTQQATKKTPH